MRLALATAYRGLGQWDRAAPAFEGLREAIRADPTGQRFFDPALPWFPEPDFDQCIALDVFDFALVAEPDEEFEVRLAGRRPSPSDFP